MAKKSTSAASKGKTPPRYRKALTDSEIQRAVKEVSRASLAGKLAEATGTKKKSAVKFLDSLTALAYREVRIKGEFVIPGIGKLVKVRSMKGTPTTKLHPKTVVKFRIAQAARDSVLGKGKASEGKGRLSVTARRGQV